MKHCNACKEDKPDIEFYTSNRTRCKPCVRKAARENKNKDPIRAREWRKQDKRKKRREQGCLSRKVVAERAALRRMGSRAARRKAAESRAARAINKRTPAERYRDRYRNDPEFNLKERLRRQVRKAAKRDGVSELIRQAIKRNGNSSRVEELLGYSIVDLRNHLEAMFVKDMTWDNMGDWHIDHIIPQKAFDLTDDNEWQSCWSLSNLQPLWAKDNLSKGSQVKSLL